MVNNFTNIIIRRESYSRYHDLINLYRVFISQMTTLVVITNSWDELMCSGKISDSCCTSRIRPAKKHKHHLIWISH